MKYLLLAVIAILYNSPVFSAVSFDASGSWRVRFESKNDYDFNDSRQDYTLSQLRLGLDTKLGTKDNIFIELQDSRIFGESINDFPSINENARNQPFADSLDVHQLYWRHKTDNFEVKVGRQKLNIGDQRLVASLEWVNTARVHDGIRLTYSPVKGRKVDVFATALVSVQPDDFNDQTNSNNRYFDSNFHGIYFSDETLFSKGKVDLWWFLRENSQANDLINTYGAKYTLTQGNFSYDIQGSFQNGTFNDVKHSAYYTHLGLGYKLDQHKFGIAYNLSSGDGDALDNEHETFDNLYALNHAYYGYMDLFSLQNIHNLELTYQQANFRIALQSFWLNEVDGLWYNAGLIGNTSRRDASLQQDNDDSYVGSEIDITYKMKLLNKKLSLVFGTSVFFRGDYVDNTGNSEKNPLFVYLQTKYTF